MKVTYDDADFRELRKDYHDAVNQLHNAIADRDSLREQLAQIQALNMDHKLSLELIGGTAQANAELKADRDSLAEKLAEAEQYNWRPKGDGKFPDCFQSSSCTEQILLNLWYEGARESYEALKADRDRLLEALDLADTLLNTPEQHQDDEWYEQRKQVTEALASRMPKGDGV